MTLADRQAAIADLTAHPGYRALLDELELVCTLALEKVQGSKTDAEALHFLREWQALAKFFMVLKVVPQNIREELERLKTQEEEDFVL